MCLMLLCVCVVAILYIELFHVPLSRLAFTIVVYFSPCSYHPKISRIKKIDVFKHFKFCHEGIHNELIISLARLMKLSQIAYN